MFSYIVTGVIFVYNSFIILVCIFAVYGAYSMLRELFFSISKDRVFYIAVKVSECDDINESLCDAEYAAAKHRRFNVHPIVLCDTECADGYKKYGFDVYIKSGQES